MFSRIITKFKPSRASKASKFSFNNPQFQLSNLNFARLNPKQLRLPTFDLAKVFQFANAYFQSLQSLTITFNVSRILSRLRYRVQTITRYANRRTLLGSLAGSLGFYYAYEYNPLQTKILLSYDQTESNEKLVSSLSHLHNVHFYPSFLCTTAILQAIMNKSPPEASVNYTREPILLPDGGQITLDWALPMKKVDYKETQLHGRYYPYQPAKDNKIMFIIHGLTGGSETNYIQSIVDKARKDGYRVVVMNQRGVNQPLSTPFPFHGGTLDDLEAGLSHVQKTYPDASIVAVGTSFGGNQLIRYLGQGETKTKIAGGVLLAAPFNIDECVDEIQNTVYEKFFIKSYLEKNFLPNIDIFKSLKESHGVDIDQVMSVKSLRDYHSHFTVKLFEHKDVSEYFLQSKVNEKMIKNIKVPLLVLHAKDDPIAVHKSIPIDTLKENPNIIYAETKRGGHLCWFSGFKPKRWYSKPTVEFLDKVLEGKQVEKNKKLVQ